MYWIWNSKEQIYNKYFNDDYHNMYHVLCPRALEVFQHYYVAVWKRNCLGYKVDMSYKSYLNRYRLSCKQKIVELLSVMMSARTPFSSTGIEAAGRILHTTPFAAARSVNFDP